MTDKLEHKNKMLAGVMARYISLVFRTSKRVGEPAELQQGFDKNAPLILGGWHGTFLLAPVLMPEPEKVSAVVARHGDAELIGLMLERFGVKLIRGAGAGGKKKDKGGVHALRMSLRALKQGRSIAMTADVPPGPAQIAGLGIITIARLSGRPILPVAAVTSRFKVLNSWSRFVVNLPFSKLALLAGEPLHVPRNADRELMEEKRLELEKRINDLVAKGHRLVGADPRLSQPAKVGEAADPGLALKTYRGAMRLAQPFAGRILGKRAKRGKEDVSRLSERYGRSGLWRPEGALIWFHAASVGETNAVLPLIKVMRQRHPEISILLTSGTVTSAKIAAKRLPEGAVHQFIPLDTPQFMQRFLDHWRPDLALLVESEIWPNLVMETAARNIPLVLTNGIISRKSYRNWRRWGGVSRPVFGRFDLILVQNEGLQKRFIRLGAPDVRVVGNLKFDAPPLPVDTKQLRELKEIVGDRPLFLAASTHAGEEQQILATHAKLIGRFPDLLTLIVPRHPERGIEVSELCLAAGLSCKRRSKGEFPQVKTAIYIADTLGELGLFFALADIVFLGGSLVSIGGHNPVEPVRFKTALLTGPSWHNQADSFSALLKGEGALQAASSDELAVLVAKLLADKDYCAKIAGNAAAIMDEMTGTIERTLAAITPLLPGPASARSNRSKNERER